MDSLSIHPKSSTENARDKRPDRTRPSSNDFSDRRRRGGNSGRGKPFSTRGGSRGSYNRRDDKINGNSASEEQKLTEHTGSAEMSTTFVNKVEGGTSQVDEPTNLDAPSSFAEKFEDSRASHVVESTHSGPTSTFMEKVGDSVSPTENTDIPNNSEPSSALVTKVEDRGPGESDPGGHSFVESSEDWGDSSIPPSPNIGFYSTSNHQNNIRNTRGRGRGRGGPRSYSAMKSFNLLIPDYQLQPAEAHYSTQHPQSMMPPNGQYVYFDEMGNLAQDYSYYNQSYYDPYAPPMGTTYYPPPASFDMPESLHKPFVPPPSKKLEIKPPSKLVVKRSRSLDEPKDSNGKAVKSASSDGNDQPGTPQPQSAFPAS